MSQSSTKSWRRHLLVQQVIHLLLRLSTCLFDCQFAHSVVHLFICYSTHSFALSLALSLVQSLVCSRDWTFVRLAQSLACFSQLVSFLLYSLHVSTRSKRSREKALYSMSHFLTVPNHSRALLQRAKDKKRKRESGKTLSPSLIAIVLEKERLVNRRK